MYQIAFEDMGPRFDVPIMENLGFQNITINPRNSVVWHARNSPLSYGQNIVCANTRDPRLIKCDNQHSRFSRLGHLTVSSTLPNFEYFNPHMDRRVVHE